MKKRILVWALLLMFGISSSFANNEEGVSARVKASFRKEFANATDVKWENSKDFVKATFNLNDQVIFAFYGESGELMAVSRNITSTQLPISLLSDLKRAYSNFWVTDLFEIALNEETNYYVTIENADKVVVLKSGGVGWTVYKKTKKGSE